MANRKEIEFFVNVPENRLQISATDNGERFDKIKIRRGENVLFKMNMMQGTSGVADLYAIEAGTTFLLGIDDVYTQSHTDHVISTDSEFQTGDWASESLPNGKLSCRVDLNTTELATALGSDAGAIMHMAVWAFPTGSSPYLLFHIDIQMLNTAVEAEASAPASSGSYVTTDQLYRMDHNTATNGSGGPIAVTFAFSFPDVPTVVASFGDDTDQLATIEIMSITATGFTFQVRDGAGINTDAWDIHWIAAWSFALSNKTVQEGEATNSTGGPIAVTFGAAFDATPTVTMTISSNATEILQPEIMSVTTTGFTFQLRDSSDNIDTSSTLVKWMAVADNT